MDYACMMCGKKMSDAGICEACFRKLEDELAEVKGLMDGYEGETLIDKIETAFALLNQAVTGRKCLKCDKSYQSRYLVHGLCPSCAEKEIDDLRKAAEPILPYFEDGIGVKLPLTQDEINGLWKAVDKLDKALKGEKNKEEKGGE